MHPNGSTTKEIRKKSSADSFPSSPSSAGEDPYVSTELTRVSGIQFSLKSGATLINFLSLVLYMTALNGAKGGFCKMWIKESCEDLEDPA